MEIEQAKKPNRLISKYKQELLVFFLAAVFFVAASLFNFSTQSPTFTKWLSPDETANYAFTKRFALTGKLTIDEPLNPKVNNIVHPRSMMVEEGQLKPMSFLGIIIMYGTLARWTSIAIIPFLTPLIGALGIIIFYFLVKRLFDRRTALLAACLLAFFPPYFYYSCRSMFHNIPFAVLTLAGLLFAVAMNQKAEKPWLQKLLFPALAGLFLGLAIITRTSELLWLGPTLVVLWFFNCKNTGVIKLLVLLAFLGIGLLPSAYYSQILHGSPLSTGYPQMNQSLTQLSQTGGQLITSGITEISLWQKVRDLIFYFGFNPKQTAKMTYNYFYAMFGWLFWGAVLGAVIFLVQFRKIKKRQLLFLSAFTLFSLVLLFYYGSWEFHDNPDPAKATIGNSYTRYWLPVYMGSIILAALGINRLSRLLKNRNLRHAARLLAVGTFMLWGATFSLVGKDEGLIESYYKQRLSQEEWQQVLAMTENNSVIITKYHDKLFFPERKVVYGLFDDDNMNRSYAKLAKLAPTYYYNFTFPAKALDYLNHNKLAKAGLTIKKVKTINPTFTLYKLEIAKQSYATYY
jgi:hypothetical protein